MSAALIEFETDDIEQFSTFCAEQGWGDGLPLVPPTPERVERMLSANPQFDPDEVVASLPPRDGLATIGIIAVNAVMAGCPDACLPVLVAAVTALGDTRTNLRGVNATTHPVAPLLIVHGAIVTSAGYNSGLGAFGPGNQANATTGRALRLILLHVAGAVAGPGDASTQGGPAKYTYCVAENLAESPWPSLARSAGVESPSAITLFCGEGPHNVHDMESDNPSAILDKVASAMCSLGQNNAPIAQGEYFVGLCPEHAAACASSGWTRDAVSTYLYNRGRIRAGDLRDAFALRAWAPWQGALGDDEMMPMTEHPRNIKVFVVGGAGKHSSLIPSWGMTASVTVAVR